MLPSSAQRVERHTSDESDQQIRRNTQVNLAYYADHPDQIDRRLRELDEEWDVERMLQLNSSALSLLGITLGITRSRSWLLLPLAVQGFFLQHGLEGWCPPLPIFRKLGIRMRAEIETERYALKAMRGDFANVQSGGSGSEGNGSAALQASRR